MNYYWPDFKHRLVIDNLSNSRSGEMYRWAKSNIGEGNFHYGAKGTRRDTGLFLYEVRIAFKNEDDLFKFRLCAL